MNAAETWHEQNTRELASAIAEVRSLLERKVGAVHAALPQPIVPMPKRESFFQVLSRYRFFASGETILLPDQTQASPQGASPAPEPPKETAPSALAGLVQKLGLSAFERQILVLCAAMELDTSIATLCAQAQGARAYPTFALALSLFPSGAWEALSPERPLRYWRLIEINQQGGQPLTVSALRIDEWVLSYLKGLTYLDDRLTPLMAALGSVSSTSIPASQQGAAHTILDRLQTAPRETRLPLIQLAGADAASKRRVSALVCGAIGLEAFRLPWNLVPSASADLESFTRLWRRQNLLSPIALYLDLQGMDGESPQSAQVFAVRRLLDNVEGVVFVDSREPWSDLPSPALTVDVAKPLPVEQKAAWLANVGPDGAAIAPGLAAQFNLNLDDIADIAAAARSGSHNDASTLADRLWDASLAATRPRMDMLAQRIEPKVNWDDIVLPAAESRLLHQIADQVGRRAQVYQDWGFDKKNSRGLGINALFAGDSGTGKTMAAEVIASHLRLNLYRIDLSAVVSKYIGETEKNLRRLFDAAEDGGAMLFFDEADALFGKRSEVKDSHDRYANIEINYLLQRMESFGGLAILATNQKSTLDPAFMRRLRFVVNFPFPGVGERKAIWQRAFPAETPTEGLDFDRLAKLNLTGGHITLIALNAAFVAANAGAAVSMPIVLEAARTEYRKLERPIHEPDFRWPPTPVRIAGG